MLHALLLTITVSFGGTPVQCAVDTGSAITVISHSVAERIPAKQALPGATALQGVGSQPMLARLYTVPRVATGELSWPDATIAMLPDEVLGTTGCLLGMDLLSRQPVVLDWQTRRVLPFRQPAVQPAAGPLPVLSATIAPDAGDHTAPAATAAPVKIEASAPHITDSVAADGGAHGASG